MGGGTKKHHAADAATRGHNKSTSSADVSTLALTASSSNAGATSAYASLSFADVLEDLSSRFIVNLPAEELASIERICFQVEQAHWFYEDFLRPLNPTLPSFALRRFSIYLLHTAALTVPLIQRYISTSSKNQNQQGLEEAFEEFLKYKTRVPVCGAVILNKHLNKCLLVKGWKASASWGFPKGKINRDEPERDCAIREVMEETGFDCSPYIEPDSKDFMEMTMRENKIRLYIVAGIDETTQFETMTRKEISRIEWFKLDELPTWKKNKAPPQGMGGKFYLISPFIGRLKQWIHTNGARYSGYVHDETNGFAQGDVSVQASDASQDLKALLGVSNSHENKASHMIEEHGDARSRQLLDLLRGVPNAHDVTPGTPVAIESLDEREKGTAQLLAALNAGAGRGIATENGGESRPPPSGSDTSPAYLLSLLNGSSQRKETPLLAPQAQRTTQAQTLLDLISPSNSANAMATKQVPAEKANPLPLDKEAERAQMRDKLLSNLMSSSKLSNEMPQEPPYHSPHQPHHPLPPQQQLHFPSPHQVHPPPPHQVHPLPPHQVHPPPPHQVHPPPPHQVHPLPPHQVRPPPPPADPSSTSALLSMLQGGAPRQDPPTFGNASHRAPPLHATSHVSAGAQDHSSTLFPSQPLPVNPPPPNTQHPSQSLLSTLNGGPSSAPTQNSSPPHPPLPPYQSFSPHPSLPAQPFSSPYNPPTTQPSTAHNPLLALLNTPSSQQSTSRHEQPAHYLPTGAPPPPSLPHQQAPPYFAMPPQLAPSAVHPPNGYGGSPNHIPASAWEKQMGQMGRAT